MIKSEQLQKISAHFFFPFCVVGEGKSNFAVEAINSAFSQVSMIDLEDIIGKSLIDDDLIHMFKGREDIIQRCLSDVEKTNTPISLILYSTINSEVESVPSTTWLLAISPLYHLESPDQLLLIFHEISDAEEFGAPPYLGANNSLKQKAHHRQTQALKDKVQSKQAQFEAAADELNNFVYSVSHDLRAPLRRIDGFSQELIQSHSDQLDEAGVHYLERIRQGAQDMGTLIDDLLKLSRISRQQVQREPVDIARVASTVFEELMELEEPDRKASFTITADNTSIDADPGLVKVVLTNLISNALKFSSSQEESMIELGEKKIEGQPYLYIKDNGVGFDPAHSDKLFRAFSRLHSPRDFAGTGIGLATVKRIVSVHGGHIFARSTPGEGATFFFNLHKPK